MKYELPVPEQDRRRKKDLMVNQFLRDHVPPKILSILQKGYYTFVPEPEKKQVLADELIAPDRKERIDAPVTVPTPEILSMTLLKEAEYLKREFYTSPEDYVAVVPDVLFCSKNNIVLSADRRILLESVSTATGELSLPRWKQERKLNGHVALWRSRRNGYYHTVLDNLPRLLALDHPAVKKLGAVQLVYSGELFGFEKDFLTRFCPPHVKPVEVKDGAFYRIENLVLTPFKTRRFAGYLPDRYVRRMREAIVPETNGERANRIYISRSKAGKRGIRNEDELLSSLKKFGFKQVFFEGLSIERQAGIMSGAEMVVSAHGAGLANLVHARKTKIVELFPSRYVLPHYYYLSKALGHSYTYWCGKMESRDSHFDVNTAEVAALVERIM